MHGAAPKRSLMLPTSIFSVNFYHSECVMCRGFGEVSGGDSFSQVLVLGEGGKLEQERTTNRMIDKLHGTYLLHANNHLEVKKENK